MNLRSVMLTALLLTGISLNAGASDQNQNLAPVSFEKFSNQASSLLTFNQGISNRKFSWAISAGVDNPATLSHLDYQNIEIQTTQIKINLDQFSSLQNSYFKSYAQFSFGQIADGNLVDSDFNGPIQNLVHTQSLAALDGSKTFELQVGFTQDISSKFDGSSTLDFGMQWLSDDYQQHSGMLSIRNSEILTTPETVQGLNSRYTAHWIGPYIGLSKKLHTNLQDFSVSASLHSSAYLAEGQWNLRQDLAQPKSFEQRALSAGIQLKLQHSIHLFENASFQQTLGYAHFANLYGQDKLYKANGESAVTQLTEVKRSEINYSLGVMWRL